MTILAQRALFASVMYCRGYMCLFERAAYMIMGPGLLLVMFSCLRIPSLACTLPTHDLPAILYFPHIAVPTSKAFISLH